MLEAIHNILVPVDDSEQAAAACEQATQIAKLCDASLTFMNVIHENESLAHILTDDERDALVQAREKLLADYQARATAIYPELKSESKIQFGDARQIVLNELNDHDYQMAVLGATGKTAIKRVLIGSVAQFIVRHAPVPVLLVRQKFDNIGRLLVPSDGSDPSDRALDLAIALGKHWHSNIDLLAVTEDLAAYSKAYNFQDFHDQLQDNAKAYLEPIETKYTDDEDISLKTHIIDGDPRLEILKFAQTNKINMIVMGASGKGSMKRLLLGSVSEYVLMHSEANVLIVH